MGLDLGPKYGQQFSHQWRPGDESVQVMVDVTRAQCLWRVSVVGDVLVHVSYGTTAEQELPPLLAPLVATFPGQLTISARPRDFRLGATAKATLVPVSAPLVEPKLRHFVDAREGAVDLDPHTVAITGQRFGRLELNDIEVRLPMNRTVPVTTRARLLRGAGLAHLEV